MLLSRVHLVYLKPNSTLGMTLKKYTTEFSPFIWFTIFCYLICAIFLMNIFSKIHNDKIDLSSSFLFVIGSICKISMNIIYLSLKYKYILISGSSFIMTKWSIRILGLTILISSFVVNSFYSSKLLGNLLLDQIDPPLNSLEDVLLNNHLYKLELVKYSSSYSMFSASHIRIKEKKS